MKIYQKFKFNLMPVVYSTRLKSTPCTVHKKEVNFWVPRLKNWHPLTVLVEWLIPLRIHQPILLHRLQMVRVDVHEACTI